MNNTHGYEVSEGYTHGFYREMAPDWIDLCAALGGVAAPREKEPAKFRYLELGSGQGLGLCLLAAANPDTEFVGVDFMADQVAHGRKIAESAGLANVRFIEADFMELGNKWPKDLGTFDYVVLHGIYTWVGPSVRAAIVDCLRAATRPGGLVYVGFNAQPGWLGSMPFQHISRAIKDATGQAAAPAIQDSIRLFERLLQADAVTFDVLPALKARLGAVRNARSGYLVQEYMHDHWQPMWHSEVAQDLAAAELDYAAPAVIAEALLPDMLPPALKAIVLEQGAKALRQDVQDFVINQALRLDLYRRGSEREPSPRLESLAKTRLHLLARPAKADVLSIETSFGEVQLRTPGFAGIVDALEAGPLTIGELGAMFPEAGPNLLRNLILLLEKGILAVGAASPAPVDSAQRLNAAIARGACEGAPYGHVAAAAIGSAIAATDVELMLLDCLLGSSGMADAASLAKGLLERLAKLRRKLQQDSSIGGSGSQEAIADFSAAMFLDQTVPRWRRLGVLA